jgi:hypothetical protein
MVQSRWSLCVLCSRLAANNNQRTTATVRAQDLVTRAIFLFSQPEKMF